MRKALSALMLCLSIVAPRALATDKVNLVRVWPGYRDAASFTKLAEYFSSANEREQVDVLRTQPQARAGYYWLLRTATVAAQSQCTLTIQVLRVGKTEADTHTFILGLPAGSHAVHAGLTGRDWIDPEERPIAWHLKLSAADGTTLATTQSFLWPEAPST